MEAEDDSSIPTEYIYIVKYVKIKEILKDKVEIDTLTDKNFMNCLDFNS